MKSCTTPPPPRPDQRVDYLRYGHMDQFRFCLDYFLRTLATDSSRYKRTSIYGKPCFFSDCYDRTVYELLQPLVSDAGLFWYFPFGTHAVPWIFCGYLSRVLGVLGLLRVIDEPMYHVPHCTLTRISPLIHVLLQRPAHHDLFKLIDASLNRADIDRLRSSIESKGTEQWCRWK